MKNKDFYIGQELPDEEMRILYKLLGKDVTENSRKTLKEENYNPIYSCKKKRYIHTSTMIKGMLKRLYTKF